MKQLRLSDDSSKKAKINLVKVGAEDLYHVREELSLVADEVDSMKKSRKMKKMMLQAPMDNLEMPFSQEVEGKIKTSCKRICFC